MVRGLRLLLLLDAAAMLVASTITDPIVSDVALAPLLLVSVVIGIACLSGDLVAPRARLPVICSALTIVAPFPFLVLGAPWGTRAAAAVLATLQIVPLIADRRRRPPMGGPRRVIAALTITTAVLLVGSVFLIWYGATYLIPAPKGVFTRSPYLVSLTTTRAQFAWQTSHGAVQLSARAPDGSVVRAAGGVLGGLSRGTRYVWTANLGGVSAAAGSFRTAPTTTATPIRLVSFGDYGSGNAHEYAIGRLAAATDPSLFLSAGDNAYLLAAPPFLDRAIFTPLRPLLAEAAPVVALGEHDLAWNDGSAVISAFHLPGHHYTAQYGPVQVVVLGLQADGSALSYARQVLGTCGSSCPVRFVLLHRPIGAGNPIMPLLRARHVAAILAGHLHRYERHDRGGVLQFTLGTGGEGAGSAQFTRPTPDAIVSFLAYGFLEIDIHGDSIAYRFIDQGGGTRDHVEQRIPGLG